MPAGLQHLTFGEYFDQSLDNVTWPESLHSLTFGEHFDQSLDNVQWPAALQSLTLPCDLRPSQDYVLPGTLDHLAIGELLLQR